jgi:hypothetical protein
VAGASDGVPFQVSVERPDPSENDSADVRVFSYLTARDLGAIVGVVAGVPADSTIFIDAFREPDGQIEGSSAAPTSGTFAIGRLRAGGYSLRIRRDDNGNGKWDGGILVPFERAEPLFWRADSVRVRARWDTDVDTLRTSITDR